MTTDKIGSIGGPSNQPNVNNDNGVSSGSLIERPKKSALHSSQEPIKKEELSFANVDVNKLIEHFNKIEKGTLNPEKATRAMPFIKNMLASESISVETTTTVTKQQDSGDSSVLPAPKKIGNLRSQHNDEHEQTHEETQENHIT
jgi:hypothetical protein